MVCSTNERKVEKSYFTINKVMAMLYSARQGNRRNTTVNVSLFDEEKSALKEMADADQRSMGSFVRKMILERLDAND